MAVKTDIEKQILKILNHWKYDSIYGFLMDCKNGKIRECEMDAIGLTNLLDKWVEELRK